MLAIATSGHLTIADPSVLRRNPPALPATRETSSPEVVASTWSADNTSLYVASSKAISRYDALGNLMKTVYGRGDAETTDEPIGSFITKDRGTLIFSTGQNIHILEHSISLTASSKVVQTLQPHPDPRSVLALSLSNDNTLLAAASPSTVLIHNLSLNSHTILRGLPFDADGDSISACVFHPHSRVRLFLAIGRQLVVYDITRPSGPTRVIPMGDAASGDIVAIACSPYSKTLLAVACSEGYVALIDLDKDPGRIRSFGYKVAVTSLVFSVDGASLYVGTETGKLLVQTLRSMEAPKSINVGGRVEALAISKKTRLSVDSNAKTTGSVNQNPLAQQDINSPRRTSGAKILSPLLAAVGRRPKPDSVASPMKRSSSTGDTEMVKPIKSPVFLVKKSDTPVRKRVSSTTAVGSRKVSELKGLLEKKLDNATSTPPPVKRTTRTISRIIKTDPVKVEATTDADTQPTTSPLARKPSTRVSTTTRPKPSLRGAAVTVTSPTGKTGDKPVPPRTRTISATTRKIPASDAGSPGGQKLTPRPPLRNRTMSAPKSPSSLAGKSPAPSPRTRTVSATSRTTTTTARTASSPPISSSTASRTASTVSRTNSSASASAKTSSSSRPRTASSMSRASASTAREASPIPPVPRIPSMDNLLPRNGMRKNARTPSPVPPVSPVRENGAQFPLIGEKPAPKRKGLSMLGLRTPEVEKWIEAGKDKGKAKDDGKKVGFARSDGEDDLGELEKSRIEDLEEEMDNLREREQGQSRDRPLSLQVTPRRPNGTSWAHSPMRHSVAGNSPGAKGAQNLLHALISDAMLDFRQDTKAEMVGLHLDLVRMGRTWRQEMRAAMSEYAGDLRELHEENRRLREENERLRRGY